MQTEIQILGFKGQSCAICVFIFGSNNNTEMILQQNLKRNCGRTSYIIKTKYRRMHTTFAGMQNISSSNSNKVANVIHQTIQVHQAK